jgi:hypothetical protein
MAPGKPPRQRDDSLGDQALHWHGYRMFVFSEFLKGLELAADQGWGHVGCILFSIRRWITGTSPFR